MSKVEVLCPNGRRVIVKVAPNTKLLKILEEACTKQGFLPTSDYELRRGRQSLDVSLSVQFAGLPNLAKLELVKSTKSRTESSVVIALQTADGQRFQAKFCPSDTLWHILEHFNNSLPSGQTLTSSQLPGEHPVCVFMKEEIVSEYALTETTLRSLGLTSGTAVIRHMFRPVDDGTIAQIISRVEEEKMRQDQLSASAALSAASSEQSVDDDSRGPQLLAMDEPVALPAASHQPVESPVDVSPHDISISTHDIISLNPSVHHQLPPQSAAQDSWPLAAAVSWPAMQYVDFKFPEETKGQNLYHNELSEVTREDFKACDRDIVVYSLDEVMMESEHSAGDDIPDDFFEVTEYDIRKMWQDLQKQTRNLTEQPLMTQASRRMHLEAEMSRYKRVIVRVQFPDRLVMQALFRTTETVHALYKVVRENLQVKSLPFELFTTPPKVVLKDHAKTLVEAQLAPMSLVYFGSEAKQDHYLSNELLDAVSSQRAANEVVLSLVPEPPSRPSSSAAASHSPLASAAAAASSSAPTRTSSASAAASSDAPKWFKMGLK